jgi:hypothetical protein
LIIYRFDLERAGVAEKIGNENLFPTVDAGAKSFEQNNHELSRALRV